MTQPILDADFFREFKELKKEVEETKLALNRKRGPVGLVNTTVEGSHTVASGTIRTISTLTITEPGLYLSGFQLDTECNTAGYFVGDLLLPEGSPQTVVNIGVGQRCPDFVAWYSNFAEGEKSQVGVYMAGGTGQYTVQTVYHFAIRIG